MTRQRLSRRRTRSCLVFVVVLFVVFGLRLFQIQGLDTSAYAAMAIEAGTARNTVPAPRGEILDRNGKDLATSVDGMTITADPSMTAKNAPRIARILVQKLGSERIDYFDTIDKLRKPKTRFIYLEKGVPAWTAKKAVAAVQEAGFTGVFTTKESLRTYPGGSLAANLIGYVDGSGKGVQGLERQYDAQLTGKDGVEHLRGLAQRAAHPDGRQHGQGDGARRRRALHDRPRPAVVRRPATRRRRARVELGLGPRHHDGRPHRARSCRCPRRRRSTRTPSARWTDYNTVSRAVQNVYEPGSVLKTVTMAALADQGKITPETPIVVPSGMTIDKFKIGDYWKHGVLHLTAAGVIAKSSNLGTIVASQQMSDQEMYSAFRKFGFGTKSGVELPGESQGILKPGKEWTKANHATIAFGQGISVTAMQMMRAVGAIANGGVMVDPTVVDGFVSADGKRSDAEPTKTRRVVSKKAAAIVTRMMEAVTAKNGTAPAAEIHGYRVAGKTGTAWRVNPVTGRYVRGQNTVSFIGFAPADKPRFLTYIVLDKPYASAGGGSTAGPVFHDIMSMALERFGVVPTGSKSPKVRQDW